MSLSLLVALLGVLNAPDPVVAQISHVTGAGHNAPRPDATRDIAPAPKGSPFAVFRVPEESAMQAKRRESRDGASSPRIVCGLTMYEMSPDVDPKVMMVLPERRVDFKIRRIIPSACRK